MACTIDQPCPVFNATNDGFAEFFVYANSVTGDAMGFVVIFMAFFIAFVGMRGAPINQSLPAALFITLVLSALLAVVGVVGQWVVYLLAAMTVTAAVLLNLSRE